MKERIIVECERRFLVRQRNPFFLSLRDVTTTLLGTEPDDSIEEYLRKFDSRVYKVKEVNIELPDGILACRLLKSCSLGDSTYPNDIINSARDDF